MKRKNESSANGSERAKRRLPSEQEARSGFRDGLFDEKVLNDYTQQYSSSSPYKHAVIADLISPTLLRSVREEIRTNISFTPKETDIYKIHQSGDLANLDGLDDVSLKLLPSLVTLRDAMYSAPFRAYLSHITGSGPLSGSKTDMAVNVYTPGCHLLCHDDVIGSRRVSYILYLTDPEHPWQASWGGALRLYPTEKMQEEDGSEQRVPSAEFTKVIPPAFNQLSFFAVQPGESFHDVEEVYARQAGEDDNDGGRVRMAISGWFHIPQEGEDGYEEGAVEKQQERSSLAQLQGRSEKYDLPQQKWTDAGKAESGEDGDIDLTEEDLTFLVKFMNPRYLMPETVEAVAAQFAEECSLILGEFLNDKTASALKTVILQAESSEDTLSWKISRPPHKHRFLYLQPDADSQASKTPALLETILNDLLPSLAFKKWLSFVTGSTLAASNILARRFRRGLDYTLATSYDEAEPQLELCLGMTPSKGWGEDALQGEEDAAEEDAEEAAIARAKGEGKAQAAKKEADTPAKDADVTIGGYEMYMAGDDNEEDDNDDAHSDHGVDIPKSHSGAASSSTGAGQRRQGKADPAVYRSSEDAEDEGVLFSMPACWNTLSLVLRDKGVLKFVKYVSKSAKGDRWDVVGEFGVVPGEDEEEDE
jgi:Rps23 Pro-64 3,4-dihydroxylase Tpa1-like proline 4-hydroxylase